MLYQFSFLKLRVLHEYLLFYFNGNIIFIMHPENILYATGLVVACFMLVKKLYYLSIMFFVEIFFY